jgi:SAM-dependent MidA family methyltransferase
MSSANSTYYAEHDPFSDFTTAPEISQVFGELLGAWSAMVWQMMGAPSLVGFVEVGPGRGTLMQDALRCVRQVAPGFSAALDLHFIETSKRLREEQALRVAAATWHDGLESLPSLPSIVLANEFLDALPIRQFVRRDRGWMERYVVDGGFVDRESDGPERDAPVGAVVEVSDAGLAWVGALARRLLVHGGAALILDYGPADSVPGDSLQALRGGKPVCPLENPGSADLTAHVDFAVMRRVALAAGADVWGPLAQGVFLGRLGLWQRIAALGAANPDKLAVLHEAAMRLAGPARMGSLFKAMCVTQPGFPAPPGFDA